MYLVIASQTDTMERLTKRLKYSKHANSASYSPFSRGHHKSGNQKTAINCILVETEVLTFASGAKGAVPTEGVSPNTFDKYVQKGFASPARRIGGRKFWLVRELESYMFEWPKELHQEGQDSGWAASA